MKEQATNQQSESAGQSSSPSLPDINTETYPFEIVQHMLDQAAYFNLFSRHDPRRRDVAITAEGAGGGVIGFRVSEVLHRFEVAVRPPGQKEGLKAVNVVGEPIAQFAHRWMVIPHDFEAMPDREPPPTPLDSSKSQRFVMLDGVCKFGRRQQDGFRGFGSGVTYPTVVNGESQLLAAAVGNIVEGFGKFKGHEGTYTYCGSISPQQGFSGALLCRVVDPEGSLRAENSLPALESWPGPEPGITYVIFRGQKKDKSQKTSYSFGPDGQVNGLNVTQQLRLLHVDVAGKGRGGLRSLETMGQEIGTMSARITFNLLNPGAPGDGLSPIPFKSYNKYTFFDREGRVVGSFEADGGEGRTFNLKLAGLTGQAALRFGGFGPLLNGAGLFKGIQGLMTDNSVVGVAPHALATLYVLRIHDSDGKYRAPAAAAAVDQQKRNWERLFAKLDTLAPR